MKNIFLISAVLAFASCGWFGQKKAATVESEQPTTAVTETVENTEPLRTHLLDTTCIPRFNFSDDGFVDMGKDIRILLTTGRWSVSPEVYEPMLSEDWRELIYNSATERHELKTAELHLERGYNDCSGDSTVHVASGRKALLFIHGLAPQTEEVPTLALTKRRVWPDEELSFTFNGTAYKLRGEGIVADVVTTSDGERWDNVENYKLYISAEGQKEQLIVAIPSFNDQFVETRWIGDIDGDRKPDLLLDISRWYEEEVVVLYLSSMAEDGEVVGAAAISDYYFGC